MTGMVKMSRMSWKIEGTKLFRILFWIHVLINGKLRVYSFREFKSLYDMIDGVEKIRHNPWLSETKVPSVSCKAIP